MVGQLTARGVGTPPLGQRERLLDDRTIVQTPFLHDGLLETDRSVGSTIFNVLFILGACAVISPLLVAQQLVWLDVPIMLGAHLFLLALGADGMISRWEGLALRLGIIGYTLFAVRKSQKESAAVEAEYESAFRAPQRSWKTIGMQIGLIVAGLASCVLGARWMVDIAVAPSILGFDLPVAIVTCVACLPIFFTGHLIARWKGAIFVGYFIAYTGYLLAAAQRHDALPRFSAVML